MANKTLGQVTTGCISSNDIPDNNIYFQGFNSLEDNESWTLYKNSTMKATFGNVLKYFLRDVEAGEGLSLFGKKVFTQSYTKKGNGLPIWYNQGKDFMLGYIKFLKNKKYILGEKGGLHGLMSDYGIELYENAVQNFFTKMLDNPDYVKKFLSLFNGGVTHWNCLKTMMGSGFYRILNSKSEFENFIGGSVEEQIFDLLSVEFAQKNRIIYDFFSEEQKNKMPLNQDVVLLFDAETGKRLTDKVIGPLSREYLGRLTIKQQIEQFESVYGDFGTFQKLSMIMKNVYYGTGNFLYKAIKAISNPSIYSAFLSFGSGLKGLVSLFVLNSMGYITDAFIHHTKIKGDWNSFMKKYGIVNDTFVDIDQDGSFLMNILQIVKKAKEMFSQGLFNAMDIATQSSYTKRVVQDFFLQLYPGITNLDMLDKILDNLKKNNFEQYQDLMSTLHYWINESNINQRAIFDLSRQKKEIDPLNHPIKDIARHLYLFFAGWGKGKIRGAIKTISKVFDGKHGKNFAKVYDEMITSGKSSDEILAKYNRIQFEDTEVTYLLNKLLYGFLLAKYCMRRFEQPGDDDNETFFGGLQEYMSYVKALDPTLAAIETLPEYKILSSIYETFMGQLSIGNGKMRSLGGAMIQGFKTLANVMTRGLYNIKIPVQVYANINRDWNKNEKPFLQYVIGAIQDNCNQFLYYTKDTIDNGIDEYYLPRGPRWLVRKMLGLQDKEIEFVNDEQQKLKISKALTSLDNFTNWVLYNFPFLKQYNMGLIDDKSQDFIKAVNEFKESNAYKNFINDKLPVDFTDQEMLFAFNMISKRIQNKEGKIDDNLREDYSYLNKDKELRYQRDMQRQENIVSYLMKQGLTEEQSNKLIKQLSNAEKPAQEEAIRTLGYLEAKTPGSSMQALAFIMSREMFKKTYDGVDEFTTDEEIELRRERAKIEVAKKYSQYFPYVDKERFFTQLVLRYVKGHGYALGEFISTPKEKEKENTALSIISPDTGFSNSLFTKTFQAQMITDIYAAHGDINAYKLKNAYSLILDINGVYNDDGSVNDTLAKNMMRIINATYNHIDNLGVGEEEERKLKQGLLMFSEPLMQDIIKNPELMGRKDVREAVNDRLDYWYDEIGELDELALKYVEETLESNGKVPKRNIYGKKGGYGYGYGYGRGYGHGYYNRYGYYNKGLSNRYNTMKDKTYGSGSNLWKYKVYNWTPTQYSKDYLSETDYKKIRDLMGKISNGSHSGGGKSGGGGGGNNDNGIGVSTKRGKAFQFYKMEDPEKPVEYHRPWRARLVRRGSGNAPIASSTRKRLK